MKNFKLFNLNLARNFGTTSFNFSRRDTGGNIKKNIGLIKHFSLDPSFFYDKPGFIWLGNTCPCIIEILNSGKLDLIHSIIAPPIKTRGLGFTILVNRHNLSLQEFNILIRQVFLIIGGLRTLSRLGRKFSNFSFCFSSVGLPSYLTFRDFLIFDGSPKTTMNFNLGRGFPNRNFFTCENSVKNFQALFLEEYKVRNKFGGFIIINFHSSRYCRF